MHVVSAGMQSRSLDIQAMVVRVAGRLIDMQVSSDTNRLELALG